MLQIPNVTHSYSNCDEVGGFSLVSTSIESVRDLFSHSWGQFPIQFNFSSPEIPMISAADSNSETSVLILKSLTSS